jgi:serine protease
MDGGAMTSHRENFIYHSPPLLRVAVLQPHADHRTDTLLPALRDSGFQAQAIRSTAELYEFMPMQRFDIVVVDDDASDDSDVSGMAIASALSRGTTVVVAAGNSGADAANFSPASCPGVIAVASNGITGKRAFYSNYGNTVTLSAPGGGIYQNDASSGTQANPDGFVWQALNDGDTVPTTPDYAGYAGTSQATPHVTGTVAMILSATRAADLPTPTPAQIKTILTSSARAFPVVEDHPIGAGIVDAYAAINLAVNGDDSGSNPGDSDEQATMLTKGAILSGQNANAGTSTLYSITVPAGATTLNIRTLGGSGDVSLYVKAGSSVSQDGNNADYSSSKPGTSQAIVIPQAQGTTYYIRVATQQGYNNLSILADYAQ